ncbi:lycopene cyclase domain-containing protein [Umezawaea sp. Da 62-37]|uniref:lycopene cyclase domain-containing protein n=1 Tax=Umezawaea sp. Da 62-37 TaxID=3075927 RepID=UPI0028F700DB|nr:lycopene cyclase domain-containing protein [Umezawaea sp. Da 62-37]WNV88284.1 lycopene cyclase domain-containing protein [Umezawaea sp. Da 62-37]
MDGRWEYALLLLGCLAVTAPLEFLGDGVYRRPAELVRAVLPVVLLFTAWDVVAVARRHWDYNPAFVTGLRLPGALPVEELLFFLVVPLCAVLTYEAVLTMRPKGIRLDDAVPDLAAHRG